MITRSILPCLIISLSCWACTPKVEEVAVPGGGPEPVVFRVPVTGIHPLATEQHLDVLLQQIDNASFVLLGEATTGTAEFYSWRAAITRRLIAEKGFRIIAIEGDWPAAYAVNRYIKGDKAYASPQLALANFARWPAWKWANQEVATLTQWLRTYNESRAPEGQVSFYGLDVYSLWESLESLRQHPPADPRTLAALNQAWSCLGPYNRSEAAYAQAIKAGGGCAAELAELYAAMQNQIPLLPGASESNLDALQNAATSLDAHKYYQATMLSNLQSWNIREQHMRETLDRLVNHYGPDAKIVVWANNAQVGDARYSNMAQGAMSNLGQMVREKYKNKGVYLVGLGTYQGQVWASALWGGSGMAVSLPPAQRGSWEAVLHEQEPANKLVVLEEWRKNTELTKPRPHRDLGPVYVPQQEAGYYVPTNLPNRYDAFLYLERTRALKPL